MAKRFRFSLQSLLEHRERLETEAQRVWQLALKRQGELEEEHRAVGRRLLDARQDQANFVSTSGEDLMVRLAYREDLGRQLEEARQRVEAQRKVVEEKRQAMVEAARDRKALELLKEQQRLEFKKAQNAKEQKFLDEVGQNLARESNHKT